MALFIFFSCTQKQSPQPATSAKTVTLKPPVTIKAKAPIVTLIDTCPPPRKVIIPTKPGGFAMRKSKDGLKMIQSVPPEIRPFGFFVPTQHYNTEQGLALSFVTSSCVDKRGNLWFGTFGGGASRYDGKSFTNYSMMQGLANNKVKSIFEDKNGNIWLGTAGGGISCFDGKALTNYGTAQGLAYDVVNGILEDNNGNLWISTEGVISRFDGKSFANYTSADGISSDAIFDMVIDKNALLAKEVDADEF